MSNTNPDPFGFPPAVLVEPLLRMALAEDIPGGIDITSSALFDVDATAEGVFQSKATGVLAGLPIVEMMYRLFDPRVKVEFLAREGDAIAPWQPLARVYGPVRALLSAERTILNLMMRLSGIATVTAQYVRLVHGTRARIADTRKTTPGLRLLEKYAVRAGGGSNHRLSLSDAAMIKDNHLAAVGDMTAAIKSLRARLPHTARLEVEVTSVDGARVAAKAGADIVMLDNMTLKEMKAAVKALTGKVLLEASGGINLQTVADVAKTGVDIISVGALTHSVRALDMSFELASATEVKPRAATARDRLPAGPAPGAGRAKPGVA
jgi:nicotinate-nucleotide pyrophosphorylase (carboxylating)